MNQENSIKKNFLLNMTLDEAKILVASFSKEELAQISAEGKKLSENIRAREDVYTQSVSWEIMHQPFSLTPR